MNVKTVLSIVALAFLAGCTITQEVERAELTNDANVCIIENDAVREGFLSELENVLHDKGITYVVVDRDYAREKCEWTATYTARWTWDLALYMSYAEINVYRNGVLDGKAVYDSTRGGANMGKFIDSEPKIRELVEELMQRDTET